MIIGDIEVGIVLNRQYKTSDNLSSKNDNKIFACNKLCYYEDCDKTYEFYFSVFAETRE